MKLARRQRLPRLPFAGHRFYSHCRKNGNPIFSCPLKERSCCRRRCRLPDIRDLAFADDRGSGDECIFRQRATPEYCEIVG